MSRFFSAVFLCPSCGDKFDELILREERGRPRACPSCGTDSPETIGAPLVAKASYPDGRKRHDLRRIAEASRLEAESFDLPIEKRGHHEKAIQELTKSGSKS